MIGLIWLFILCQTCQTSSMDAAKGRGVAAASSASEATKGIFAQEKASDFKAFKSGGVSVNPNYQQSSNPKQIEEQVRQKFRIDDAALLVQKSHQTREMVQIDLDHIELDANGLLKNMGDANLLPEGSFEIKTCRTPGESYNRTCKRQRVWETKVTPATTRSVPSCPGHSKEQWQWHGFNSGYITVYYSCGGCTTVQVPVPKKVEIDNEKWVGCEAEDTSHEQGLCELIDERPGPYNETRMIEGVPFTRDYWETTRLYNVVQG